MCVPLWCGNVCCSLTLYVLSLLGKMLALLRALRRQRTVHPIHNEMTSFHRHALTTNTAMLSLSHISHYNWLNLSLALLSSQHSRVEVHLIPDGQCIIKEIILIFELRENTGTCAVFLILVFPVTGQSDFCHTRPISTISRLVTYQRQ